MVIQFGFKQFLLQIFLVASFNLVAIPDILCYSSLCLRTPIPHRSVCPLDFALSTGYGSATRHKRRGSTCEILVTFTQNNSHDQHVDIFLKQLLYVYMLLSIKGRCIPTGQNCSYLGCRLWNGSLSAPGSFLQIVGHFLQWHFLCLSH
jgi:hypothetical protein